MGNNPARMERHTRVVEKFGDYIDDKSLVESLAFDLFTNDATYEFGNFPSATGHQHITACVRSLFEMISSSHHEVTKLHSVSPDVFIAEGTVLYTIGDVMLDPIPVCHIFSLNSWTDRIQGYRAYIDLNPLYIITGYDATVDCLGKPTWVKRRTHKDIVLPEPEVVEKIIEVEKIVVVEKLIGENPHIRNREANLESS